MLFGALIAYGVNATKLQTSTETQTAALSDDIAVKYFTKYNGEPDWKSMPDLDYREPFAADVIPNINSKVYYDKVLTSGQKDNVAALFEG
jgi:hypothetical protein